MLDFDYTGQEKYHTVYRMRDADGNEFSDLFEVHIIELGKKLQGNTIDEWIRLMNAGTEEELKRMIASKNIGVRMAAMKLKKLNLLEKMRWLYEIHMKEKRDRKWFENEIREEATARGLAEGRAEGELKGNISIYQEMGVSKSETIEKIAGRFHLSREEAAREVEKYWNISQHDSN